MKKNTILMVVFLSLTPFFTIIPQDISPPETPVISGGAEMNYLLNEMEYRGEQPNPIIHYTPFEDIDAPGTYIQACDFDTNATYNSGFNFIPPDCHAAAGQNYLVNVVNALIQVFDKSTGALQRTSSIKSFCTAGGITPNTFTFDPKILYDQMSSRWVFITLEQTDVSSGAPANTSLVIMGCSQTSNPLGSWYIDTIDTKINIGGTLSWFDYPGLAVDEEAIYVTGNMFAYAASGGGYQGERTIIINKNTFYSSGSLSYAIHDPWAITGFGAWATTTMPAHIYGTAPSGVGTFFVAYSGFSSGGNEIVAVMRVDNPLTTPSWNLQWVSVGNIENHLIAMPDAPQPGTSNLIETNDRRALDAVWQNNNLYLTATIVNSNVEATAYWWRLNTSTLSSVTVADQGAIDAEDIATGTFTYYPSIAVDPSGNMGVGFCASSPLNYAGAFFTYRLTSDPAGTVRSTQIVHTGMDWYFRDFGASRNRWGDYSGTFVDPVDNKIWAYNQYAMVRGTIISGQDGRWSTGYRPFYLVAPPAPTLIAPLNGATGVVTNPVFSWNSSVGAFYYTLEVATDPGFTTVAALQSGITATTTSVTGLINSTTYYWRVYAVNPQDSAASAPWSFTVGTIPPPPPLLALPPNGAVNVTLPVTCAWNPAAGAASYTIDVATDAGFTNIVFTQSGITGTSQLVSGLVNGTLYHWRVTAVNSGGSTQSTVWTFNTIVAPPPPPLLATPPNGAVNVTLPVTCSWNPSAGASSYVLEVATDAGFTNTVFTQSGITGTSQLVSGLVNGTLYHWRVTAVNSGGSAQSSVWTFNTIVAPPPPPVHILPVNGALHQALPVTCSWNPSAGASGYAIEVATDTGFTNIVFTQSGITGTSQLLSSLSDGQLHYWHVNASNSGGTCAFTSCWSFITALISPDNVSALVTEPKKVTIRWADNTANESGYLVERKLGDSSGTAVFSVITTTVQNITQFIDSVGLSDTTQYTYRVRAYNSVDTSDAVDYATVTTLPSGIEHIELTATTYMLHQNYPNPFNPTTTLRFSVPSESRVRISIYNAIGECVAIPIEDLLTSGYYEVSWDASALPSGIYFCAMEANSESKKEPYFKIIKMLLLK